ncbi:MAG: carboxylate-amine ligase [Rhodospirillales bacterium]
MTSDPSFTMGIEEEYILVDPQTREVVSDPPQGLLAACEARLAELVRPEFLVSQIEVGTPVCRTAQEAGLALARLREAVVEVAGSFGLAPIAASTHPFSEWRAQKHTDKERYHTLARAMQAVARRLLICGMHVHVGIDDDELRIDLMNQAVYFLPHLLALSTSSPFWRGEDSGLNSYRVSVFDELPRTGLPSQFASWGEYRRHVDILVAAGVLEDATMLWWDIRPSDRFPTLEMRITDICTSLVDAVAIAALYQCILHMLYRLRLSNQRWRIYDRMLVEENRWRAKRYGTDGGLIDFAKGSVISFAALIHELLDLVAEDADTLDCAAQIRHCRSIVMHGTSAHRQRSAYREARDAGASEREALHAVVDGLIKETRIGL